MSELNNLIQLHETNERLKEIHELKGNLPEVLNKLKIELDDINQRQSQNNDELENLNSSLSSNQNTLTDSNDKLKKYNDHNNHQEYIYLHINSFGGSVFSAFSVIDTIKNMKIPVVSIIEGAAASAATLISVMCDYRIIYKTSYMLIHQLSSGSWGKMNELEEEMENLKELMNSIKTIYKENTNIPRGEISEILKHDLWWNADICLAKGLVDEIKTTEKKYKFSKGLITF